MQRKFALIGHPVEHSFSADYHNQYFAANRYDCVYSLIDCSDISEIRSICKKHSLSGFNVTIPHKKTIIPLLDSVSKSAREIGAVNTVKIISGALVGFNTDAEAFRRTLQPHVERRAGLSALVFGNGGAAAAVIFALNQLDIPYRSVKRCDLPNLNSEDIAQNQLLINATPVGMHPHTLDLLPIDYQSVTSRHIMYDLVYNPPMTQFLKRGEEQNALIINGLDMLHLQADLARDIWLDDMEV